MTPKPPLTIAATLHQAEQKLSQIEDGSLVARSLLAHVLKCDPTYLFAYANSALSKAELACFEQLLSRAVNHEPLAYLVGHKEFFGLDFVVTPDVLIPRPESEQLVETALRFVKDTGRQDGKKANNLARRDQKSEIGNRSNPLMRIVDVGTGSGCIAVSLAKILPGAQVYAVDVSEPALEVARTNAERLRATNVTLLHGCLLEPLQGLTEAHSMDIIVANLPYISDEEFEYLPKNVRDFEPELALKSGSDDPDALNKQLIKQSARWLKPGGLLAYETTNGKIVTNASPTL